MKVGEERGPHRPGQANQGAAVLGEAETVGLRGPRPAEGQGHPRAGAEHTQCPAPSWVMGAGGGGHTRRVALGAAWARR